MTTLNVLLSPIWNGTQFFDSNGVPLNGGLINTYQAGSMTAQQATYTDATGTVANSNPIVLDSTGRINTEIWLLEGASYQLILTQSDGTTVLATCDNIQGVLNSSQASGLPNQSGQAGNYLTTDGTNASWAAVNSLPSQAGNAGDILSTNGTSASWIAPPISLPSITGNTGLFLSNNGANPIWETVPASTGYGYIPTQVGSYTTALSDAGACILVNASSAATLTIASYATVNYTIGTTIDVIQRGTGQVTITGMSGVTVNSASGFKTRTRYSGVTLVNVSNDSWIIIGDLTT